MPAKVREHHPLLFYRPKKYFVTNGNFKADNVAILGAFEKLKKCLLSLL
jgi:hypothetical protein